jgi:hypothetical protein
LAACFQFDGDFRAKGDYFGASNVFAAGTLLFAGFGESGVPQFDSAACDQGNDTILTNRFRLNMQVKAAEDVEFKDRLAMCKAWGMQSRPDDQGGGFPMYDGNTSALSMTALSMLTALL